MKRKNKVLVFLGFLVLFLAFFIQYPLQNSLTGNLDSIANLAMYKQLKLYIDGLFTSDVYGTLCYPLENVVVYFGADFGAGIIHVFFNYLGIPDLWANWLFMSLIFTFNSYALFLLLKLYIKDFKIAIAGSLLFNLSHFTLANLENPNALFFCFFFLSLYYYELYLRSEANNTKLLYKAAILGCIQIYLSPYIFLFHTFVWFVQILFKEPKLFRKDFLIRYTKIAILYLSVISPFLYFFVFNESVSDSQNSIFEKDYTFLFALNIPDFTRVLPNHLYKEYVEIFDNPFMSKIKSAFIGYSFYSIALLGLIFIKRKLMWLIIFIVGLILAIGPYLVKDMNTMWPSIMHPFYEHLGFGDILRVPARAFFICVFALTIMATFALKTIKDKFPKYPIWAIPFLLILIENVPLKMEVYDQQNVIQPDKEFINYLKQAPNSVLLSLPSQLGSFNGDRNEYIYMYWQHLHKQSTLNGNLAFIPEPRLATDETIKHLNAQGLQSLIQSHEITTIAFHKDLDADYNPINLLDSLRSYNFLEWKIETDRVVVYQVK